MQITETADGDFDVKWECVVKDTLVLIPMRPSHVIGNLMAAIQIIASRSYEKSKS